MLKFLTAKWQDLVVVNYAVDTGLLRDLVPAVTEVDLYDDNCFVSLLAFMFRDTRVLGLPIPFHINFEEINLRFYVKRNVGAETRRGVVFVKEIVPRAAIAIVARALYGEPYETWQTSHSISGNKFIYEFEKGGRRNSVEAAVGENLGIPDEDALGSFIIEHYWGYTRLGADRTGEYKVEHPKWELFNVADFNIDVDFGFTYGRRFTFLNGQRPFSVIFAKGSAVAVYKGKTIK